MCQKYSKQISTLKEEFSRRFSDFQALEDQFVLLTTPFSYDIDKASTDLQLELIDLQNDNILKENFKDMDLQTLCITEKGQISKYTTLCHENVCFICINLHL